MPPGISVSKGSPVTAGSAFRTRASAARKVGAVQSRWNRMRFPGAGGGSTGPLGSILQQPWARQWLGWAHIPVVGASGGASSSHAIGEAQADAPSIQMGGLDDLAKLADPTWTTQLTPDPDTEKSAPNRKQREVRSGHFVKLDPSPLPKPELVIHSKDMAGALGLSEEEVASDRFKAFFGGDIKQVAGFEAWSTPYALAIMAQPMTSNCPFGTGNGYGDGRALSLGEVVVGGQRWEMQLKGGGQTPFCRGGDGRAVLRSSVREFLASEAMHAMGVPTTRALSLVVSQLETSSRPWYSPIREDDPRLAQFSPEERTKVLSQPRNPDIMIEEKCAITTRVAPSFVRVGHIDLFSRRAERRPKGKQERAELEQMVEHALFREFPDAAPGGSLEERAEAMMDEFGRRIARLAAGWLRVGFCQGNFNSDNCLVSGRTMDYGPFGFMDKYDPLFAKWTGSGEHYAFMNQPGACLANYQTFAQALAPVLGKNAASKVRAAVEKAEEAMRAEVADVWRAKMGFSKGVNPTVPAELFSKLEPLMRRSDVEWTLFWRELAAAAEVASGDPKAMVKALEPSFYEDPLPVLRGEWAEWLAEWHAALEAAGGAAAAAPRMRACNPKYIPREWMLVEAYEEAARGRYDTVRELHDLFSRPYDEQPERADRWYRRSPKEALITGGTTFFS